MSEDLNMVEVVNDNNEEAFEEVENGSNFGLGMLAGSLVTLAGVVGVNKLRKVYQKYKEKKEAEEEAKVIDINDYTKIDDEESYDDSEDK